MTYTNSTESPARGTKRLRNETSGNESSTERNVQGTKRPLRTGNETSWERKVHKPVLLRIRDTDYLLYFYFYFTTARVLVMGAGFNLDWIHDIDQGSFPAGPSYFDSGNGQ